MATLHVRLHYCKIVLSNIQHTKLPLSLIINKIIVHLKMLCSGRGETKGYGGDSDCHCLFQIGNFGNIYTKCWPKGGTFEET